MNCAQDASWRLKQKIQTSNVEFGDVVYRPGGVCGPRIQPDFELFVLHSGACQVTVNGSVFDLVPKSIYRFRPGGHEFFRFSGEGESRHFWCSVRPSVLQPDLEKRLSYAPFAIPWSDVFGGLCETVAKLDRSGNRTALIDQLGLCFVSEFIAVSEQVNGMPPMTSAVRLFLGYVGEHYGDIDCLAAAHRAAGISRNALIYKFHAETGLTPARYLWRLRVSRGVAMLKETNLTVAEIADRCGFKDPFHFSKQVKLCSGSSPKTIRRELAPR